MPRYRKRPVEIDARQINTQDYDGLCELVAWCGGRAIGWNGHVIAIDTLEGTMEGGHGDWIIKGVAGEFYFCKPDIFTATYERVLEDGENPCEGCDVLLAEGKANFDVDGVPLCDGCWEDLTQGPMVDA